MSFALLALIGLVALAGPLISLARFARIPVVIGELAVGILLGRTGFGVVDVADPTLSFMASIGFALVMFIAGTHVPVRNRAMLTGATRGVARAVAVALVAVAAGLLVARLAGNAHGLVYAVLFASSSAGLVMPALAGVEVSSRPGLERLAQLAIADAACIVALPLAMAPARAGTAALGALLVIAAGGVLFLILRSLEASGTRRRVHELSENRGLAIELRVTLTLLFGLAAIATATHVSIMLAGFVFGLAVAGIREPRRVANQTFALTEGFLGPIFYVWLGASLDLRAAFSQPATLVLGVSLGIVAIAVHVVMVATRQPWPISVATAGQLGVPVGAATLAQTMPGFGHGEATAMLLGALVTIGAVTAVSGRLARAVTAST